MPDLLDRLKTALADRYRVDREIGRGGMAHVFLAHDLKLDRPVALKVLRPELAAVLGADRFLREITLAARLEHPHILGIHDSGETADLLYYVMPYVAGESLRQRLAREKQLSVDDALQIGREVADALSYAHSHGVIHRDIKPENILLQAGHAVVADFGIARAIDVAGGDRLTETGLALGTPTYMSPEQAAAEKDLDGRSDLYSLGCVLYELLAGEPPFTGPTVESLVRQHLTAEPPNVTALRPSAPGSVVSALQRALAKTPADRFHTAAELAAALATSAGPAPPPTGAPAPDRSPSIAVLSLDNLSSDPEQQYFCDGIAEEIINALAKVEGLRVVARTSSFAFRGRAMDVREIGRTLDVGTVLEGSVRKAGNQLRVTAQLIDVASGYHLWSERFDRRLEDVFAIQDEIAVAVVDGLRVKLLPEERASLVRGHTYDLGAYDAYLKGLFEWNTMTSEGFARAQELFREAIRLDSHLAPAHAQLADSFTSVIWWADHPPAEALAEARALAEQALALDPNLAHAHSVLGIVELIERASASAERSLRRGVALAPNAALAHTYLAWFLSYTGRGGEEAVARARLALRLDPLSPAMHVWAGAVLCFSGESAEGLRTLEHQAAATPAFWMPPFFISLAHGAAGRLAEARAAAEKAVALSDGNSVSLSTLACLCFAADDQARGDELFQRLQRRAEAAYVPPTFLAWVHATRGEQEQAVRHIELALACRDAWVGLHRLYGVVPAIPHVDALIERSFT